MICFQLFTANCVPVMSPDNLATNGVVHIVSNVLTPVVDTIADIIMKQPRLSILKACKSTLHVLEDLLLILKPWLQNQ